MRFVAMAKTRLTPLMISAFVGVTACGSAASGGYSDPLGAETEGVVTEYDILVANETSIERYVTIYRDHVSGGSHDVLSLAWKTVALQPGQEFQFKWTENYSFNWSSAALPVGASYSVTGTADAGTAINNEVVLADTASGTVFEDPTDGPEASELVIDVETANALFVGIGVGGAPLYVAQATENAEYAFDVSDPEYFLSVGPQYGPGQPFDDEASSASVSFTKDIGTVLKATISQAGLDPEVTLTID